MSGAYEAQGLLHAGLHIGAALGMHFTARRRAVVQQCGGFHNGLVLIFLHDMLCYDVAQP